MIAPTRLVAAAVVGTVVWAGSVMTSMDTRQRPPVMGRHAGVSAGHPLTTAVVRVLILGVPEGTELLFTRRYGATEARGVLLVC